MIRLDVGVGQEVSLEVGALVEAARAHWALMGGLLHVENFMDCQGARLAESLSALAAFKWFLFRMNISVN